MSICEFWEKLEKRYKAAFLSVFIVGIFAHGMALFNKFSYHDDICNEFGVGMTCNLGRWALELFGNFESALFGDGNYSIPLYIGFISFILIGISACFIINIIDVHSDLGSAFIGGIMVAFPVITGLFGFVYTLHFYMLALLFGTTGAWLILKCNSWYKVLLGVVLIAVSVGLYQAYLPTIITVLWIYMLRLALEGEKPDAIIKTAIKAVISSGTAVLLYWYINKIFLIALDVQMIDYRGLGQVGKVSIVEYLKRVYTSYYLFFFPNKDVNFYMYPGNLIKLYYVTVILGMYLTAIEIFNLVRAKKLYHGIIFGIGVVAFPVCSNFVFVMVKYQENHTLMEYAQIFAFIFCVWLLEKVNISHGAVNKVIRYGTVMIFALVLLMYTRYDNRCYMKATFSQQQAISYFTNLSDRIKSTAGYDDELPVIYINAMGISDKTILNIDEFADINILPYDGMYRYVNNYMWEGFMKKWCGFAPTKADPEKFTNNPEIESMPSYPDDGSIRIINDTVVVKF